MAVRVTAEDVQEIIEIDTAISLVPFIAAANAVVNAVCVAKGYSEEALTQIELWLSAHFYTIRDPRITSESAAGVGASYQHAEGLGFDSSSYGQMAKRLDYLGALAALDAQSKKGGKVSVGLYWSGEYNANIAE